MQDAAGRRAALTPETRIAAALHHLDRHRRVLDARTGLGTADLRLLWLLSDGRPRSLRAIAQELHLEQSTVNRQVNAALRAGHLRRYRDAGSAASVVEPTDEGRRSYERETATTLALYREVLGELGPDDADRLTELLGRFADLYGSAVDDLPGT